MSLLHQGERGLFADSAVVDYTTSQVVEAADYLPDRILPAYVGTGYLGMAVDASGLQSLDCRLASTAAYGKPDYWHTDDLYFFGERLLGGVLGPNTETFNLFPLAWPDYEIEVDGQRFHPTQLEGQVTKWRRVTDFAKAKVATTLELKSGVALTITVFAPQQGQSVYARFSLVSTDGKPHRARLWPRLNVHLRERSGGAPILDEFTTQETGDRWALLTGRALTTGATKAYEDYNLAYGLACAGDCKPSASESRLELELRLEIGATPVSRDVVFFVGNPSFGEVTPEAVQAAFKPLYQPGFDALLATHQADWTTYWSQAGEVRVGDALRELMWTSSLYLFRCGTSFETGMPLQFLMFHPECWGGGTFWDLDFAADGLIAAGQLAPVGRVITWLAKVVAPEGRSFHWITRHDGTQGMNPKWGDSGFMVNASHAMTAIRYYETTKDEAFLVSTIYPLLRKVATYLATEKFIKEGDHYIGGAAGLDANQVEESNETYSTAWFAVILTKTADYAEQLGQDSEQVSLWREIVSKLQLEQGPQGYNQSRHVTRPGMWLSMLLYPTEAAPLVDLDVFRRNRAVQSWIEEYGTEQPWCYFWSALSDMRLDMAQQEVAEDEMAGGMRHVYGPAQFCEIIPGGPLEGIGPYTSAHGAYLAALAGQLVSGSIWDDSLRLFVDLPASYRERGVSFKRLRTGNGVTVSGRWGESSTKVSLVGEGLYQVTLRLPTFFVGKQATLLIDGKPISAEFEGDFARFEIGLVSEMPATITIAK